MLRTLLETGRKKERRALGALASVTVHVALIAAVCGVSNGIAKPPRERTPVDTTVVYTPAPPVERAPTDARAGGGTSAAGPTAPTVAAPVDIPTGIPDPAEASLSTDLHVGPAEILAEVRGGGESRAPHGGAWSDATVDEPPRAVREIVPRYPEALRAAGVEGEVVVMFVIDTTGRARQESLRVISASHEQFATAVMATLRDARFAPGRVNGRAVPTLVQRSFRFAIAGYR
ncbi:MAG TPA: TonB family protein [Gemmatimonadaceae bacterium]|nr:TonB family protein [Gemmatimonadaceae bacterium]